MYDLNVDWVPEFGFIVIWLAMDKNGKLALMVNNCWGDVPKVILVQNDIKQILYQINDFLNEESDTYNFYPKDKEGDFILDFYSSLYMKNNDHNSLISDLRKDLLDRKNLSDVNIVVNKGIFIYQAVEGNQEGDDYPVGYEGETKMGDYYRYLLPTIYATIDDFPRELWNGVALSKTLDFTKDRVVFNNDINQHFTNVVSDLF